MGDSATLAELEVDDENYPDIAVLNGEAKKTVNGVASFEKVMVAYGTK